MTTNIEVSSATTPWSNNTLQVRTRNVRRVDSLQYEITSGKYKGGTGLNILEDIYIATWKQG